VNLFADVETTTKNKGHPFNPDNFLVSYALIGSVHRFGYYTEPDFLTVLREEMGQATCYINFACKFDIHWFRRVGLSLPLTCKIWDCQLAEFVLNNQRGAYGSLNDALATYGLESKSDKVKEYWDAGISTENIPVPILEEYNIRDVQQTRSLYEMQVQLMSEAQRNLVYALGEDLRTLADAEYNGIKWDEDAANKKLNALSEKIQIIHEHLGVYLPPISHGGFNWDSGDCLSALLYGGTLNFLYSIPESAVYKSGPNKGTAYTKNRWFDESVVFPKRFTPLERTEVKKTKDNPSATTRFYQVDDPTLAQLKTRSSENKELIRLLRERSKLLKIAEMIESINKKRAELNWQDDLLHAQFNQNVAITGRLSSSNPNMQNTPAEIDELLVSRYD
jgi:DNA polymerase I-like protein with 3'-5' exonuclease and polymerase domains